MALYHFHVTQVKRSAGQSAIAAAAYRAGENLYSEYYGENADYTRKGGVICSGILLPEHAPSEYADRATLWNSVELAEKNKKAQLAYSFDISLQNEFSMDENIALVRQFLQEEFVARGMIADYAVHFPDKDGGIRNPHFHVLCPMRPLNEDGTWGAKQHRVYKTDENGQRLRDDAGHYIFDAVPTTEWGTPEMLEHWRERWAEMCNQKFAEKNIPVRIDHRSYERQGIELLPTIHEGPTVRAMELKGIHTDKGDLNCWIKETNSILNNLRGKLKDLLTWIHDTKEILSKPSEPQLLELLGQYIGQRNAGTYSQKAKVNNVKQLADIYNLLITEKVFTLSDLEQTISSLYEKSQELKTGNKEISDRMKEIRQTLRYIKSVRELKPVAEKLNTFRFKKSREKYQTVHDTELKQYYAARRYLDKHYPDKKIPEKSLQMEYAELESQYESNSGQISDLWAEYKKWINVKAKLTQVLPKEHHRDDRNPKHRGEPAI